MKSRLAFCLLMPFATTTSLAAPTAVAENLHIQYECPTVPKETTPTVAPENPLTAVGELSGTVDGGEASVEALFGDHKPAFVYVAEGRDPLVIEWEQQAAEAIELLKKLEEKWRSDPRNLGVCAPSPYPVWIGLNFTGVIYDNDRPGESVALIGDDTLKIGDRIPRYWDVLVTDIQPATITIEYHGAEHLLTIRTR